MQGQTDFYGVDEQKEFGSRELLPDGKYNLQIVETLGKETKKGDPMISIKLLCVEGQYSGSWVWDNIVIPTPDSPGWGIAGRTMHFLHCIGEPFQGNFAWNSDNWMYKNVKVSVGKELYNDKPKNIISGYLLDEKSNQTNTTQKATKDDLPF